MSKKIETSFYLQKKNDRDPWTDYAEAQKNDFKLRERRKDLEHSGEIRFANFKDEDRRMAGRKLGRSLDYSQKNCAMIN
jgi:hypothetical protein